MARSMRNALLDKEKFGTLANPGKATSLNPTISMQVGATLNPYLQKAKDLFPEKDGYSGEYGQFDALRSLGNLLLGDSPERTARMAEGYPHQYTGAGPNDPIIRPEIVDLAGALPIGTVANFGKAAVVPGAAFAASKLAERGLGITDAVKKAQREGATVGDVLLGAGLQHGGKPEMQSLIFTGERSGLADNDRTIRERFLKAQMMEGKKSDEQIFKETGLERGADGLFRLEISDDTAKVSLPDYMTGEQIQSKLDEYNARMKELSKEMKQYEKPSGYRQFNDPKGVELAEQYDEILAQRGQLPKRPEINTTLGEVLDHPTLYQAYPELAEYKLRILPEGAEGGFFDPTNKAIEIGGRDKELLESSLLHEVQHGVQRLEDFAIGGNPAASAKIEIEAAKAQGREAFDRLEQNTKLSSGDFRQNRDEAKVRYDLMRQISDVVGYENIPAPRFLFNTGEYYKYSDEISRELGKMSSRNPKKRQWIEQAGQMIANRKLNELMAYSPGAGQESIDKLLNQVTYYRQNRKELKNAMRRAEYGYNKYVLSDAGRAYSDMQRSGKKVQDLRRQSDMVQEDRSSKDLERYRKLGGEVEARNVETRKRMTTEERQQRRGLLTEDVPRDKQILLRPSQLERKINKARSIPESLPMDAASRLQRALLQN